jgi:hypothetical protein
MERFSMEVPAWISLSNESERPNSFEAMTRDICAGGAFLITDQLLSVGTGVEMIMILSFNHSQTMENRHSRIDVSGSVVRMESQGIAVCFNNNCQISPMA